MSTDPTSAVPPTADPAARAASRRFRRTLAALLTGLIVLCLALVAVNLLNGPRLTGSDVDTSAVVTAANQRLVLETNQQLTEVSADQVTVSPAGARMLADRLSRRMLMAGAEAVRAIGQQQIGWP